MSMRVTALKPGPRALRGPRLRWGHSTHLPLSFRAVRSRRREPARNLLLWPRAHLSLIHKPGKKKQAGRIRPAAVSFPSTGGAGVSTCTLGKCVARAPSPAYSLPRRRSQGMPQGYSGRKLTLIINVGERRYQPYGLPASVRSIAFSASGAIIVYPALFGCSPSSARSRFSSPFSSTIALK